MKAGAEPWGRLRLFGAASLVCYAWLFLHLNDRETLSPFIRKEGLLPVLPVVAAFVFSFFHRNFTGDFWDVVGVQAKAPKPQSLGEEIADEAEGSED